MVLFILGIAAWMGLMGLIAYEAGSFAARSFIGTGVNASLQKWQVPFQTLVIMMGSIMRTPAIWFDSCSQTRPWY